MNDAEMTPESEAPKGEVPQDVADSVMALRNEAQAMARAVDRGWKITAIVFAVVILIVAGYLYAGVYRAVLKPYLRADIIVQLGASRLDDALAEYGAPKLRSGAFPDWAAQELKGRAPEVMRDYVRPRLEELPEQLPKVRAELVSKFRQNAPQLMDQAVNVLIEQVVPQARSTLISTLKDRADEALDEVEGQFEEIVSTVVAAHKEDVRKLGQTDWAAVRSRMEQEFEREMGPILDRVFEGLTAAITDVRAGTEVLVQDYRSGTLTDQQKLEIQLIRLVRALFRQKAAQPQVVAKSLFEQIMENLQVTGEAAPEFSEVVTMPAGVGRAPTVDEIDWGQVPAEHRENARKMYEEAMRKAGTAPTPGRAPMALPSLEDLPEPDWSQVPEEHREEAKRAYREGIEEAKRRMKEAQEKAEQR